MFVSGRSGDFALPFRAAVRSQSGSRPRPESCQRRYRMSRHCAFRSRRMVADRAFPSSFFPAVRLSPIAVVEVAVGVGDLAAVQPVDPDAAARTGGAGVRPGVDRLRCSRSRGRPILYARMALCPGIRPPLHERVVRPDLNVFRAVFGRGDEQQPELAARPTPDGTSAQSERTLISAEHAVGTAVTGSVAPTLCPACALCLGVPSSASRPPRAARMVPPLRWIRPQSMPGRSLEHSRTPSVSRSPSCTVYENSRAPRRAPHRPGILGPAHRAADLQPDMRAPGQHHRHVLAHREAHRDGPRRSRRCLRSPARTPSTPRSPAGRARLDPVVSASAGERRPPQIDGDPRAGHGVDDGRPVEPERTFAVALERQGRSRSRRSRRA